MNAEMEQVVIVIPMYRETLSWKDKLALEQLRRVLWRYPRVFAMPESLQPRYGGLGRGMRVERFRDDYFRGTLGYSSLMLSDDFYARFADYEYVLVYQTDAFVFHDALASFCAMGYDYIGAPVGRMDAAWHVLGAQVGNGGFSLRRIAACRRVLAHWRSFGEHHPFQDFFLRWEDMFFSYCGTRKDLAFRVPDLQTALSFAVQGDVAHAYRRIARGWRPFGCHGWDKLRFEGLKGAVEEASGQALPAFTEEDRRHFCALFRAFHRYREGVDVMPLVGMARQGKYEALAARLQRELDAHPPRDAVWEGKAEMLGLLWRLVRMEGAAAPAAERSLRLLEEALYRSCLVGDMPPDMAEDVFALLPQLPRRTETAERLRKAVCDVKWRQWDGAAQYAAPYAGPREKRIIAAVHAGDDEDIIESFVRHTLTFADGVLVDVHASRDGSRRILQRLQAEGLAVEWMDSGQAFPAFLRLVREASEADFVLALPSDGFLLPAPGQTVRGTLESLTSGRSYEAPVRFYAPLHEEVFKDKFLLARALVRSAQQAPQTVVHGRGADGRPAPVPLELARFPWRSTAQAGASREDVLGDVETVDIAPLIERQEILYD